MSMLYKDGQYTMILPTDEVAALRKAAALVGGLITPYTEWSPEEVQALRDFHNRFGAKLR